MSHMIHQMRAAIVHHLGAVVSASAMAAFPPYTNWVSRSVSQPSITTASNWPNALQIRWKTPSHSVTSIPIPIPSPSAPQKMPPTSTGVSRPIQPFASSQLSAYTNQQLIIAGKSCSRLCLIKHNMILFLTCEEKHFNFDKLPCNAEFDHSMKLISLKGWFPRYGSEENLAAELSNPTLG